MPSRTARRRRSPGRHATAPEPTAPGAAGTRALDSRWLVGGIVALAILLRVGHVLALRATPWFEHLVVDPEFYDEWARRIAAGDWIGDRAFYMDPLYPYVLAVVYRWCGRDLLLVRLLQVALSAGSCLLVWRLGTRLGGRAIGALAGLGFAVYKPEIFYVAEVDKTCLSIFLTASALVLLLGRSPASRFGAGAALGLAALTRANFLLLAPLAALVILRDPTARATRVRGMPGSVAAALLFTAGVGAVVAPVAWRNHHVSGAWVVTTSQAGQNFYTGNNPTNPYGAYGAVPFVRGNPHFEEIDFRAAAEARAGRPLDPAEVSRFWFTEAFAHMRDHPAFAVRAFLRKAALFWNDFEISDNQDQYLLARQSWVLALPLLGFGWIAPWALLGAVTSWRTSREVRVLCGFVLVYFLSVVAFFIFSRYRIHVVPALLPLAAIGIFELAERTRTAEPRRIVRAAVIVAAAGVFSLRRIGIFSPDQEQVVEMQLSHLGEIYVRAGDPERAIAAYQEAVARCPLRCRHALGALFDTYVAAGRVADGEVFFRRFVRDHPEHRDGPGYLARLIDRGTTAP